MARWMLAAMMAFVLGAAPPRPTGLRSAGLGKLEARGSSLVGSIGGTVTELTLDPRLQADAERLLAGARPLAGAVVVVEVSSGRLLTWAERRRDGRGPSVVTTARAPAASVFKVVTTAALFERAEVTPSEPVCIAGGLRAIERRHLEVPRGGDVRCSPFFQALGHSKNAAYAQLATHRLLRADLLEVAEGIGFNRTIPFDFPVLLGTLDVPYGDLDFARTAAGFRGTTLTPLGGAYLATVIATGGLSPRLRVVPPEDDSRELEVVGRVMSSTTARRLERMMEVTVESGTARSAFHDELGRPLLGSLKVAGKTGTLHPSDAGKDDGAVSWFIGFAPARRPEIVVSVLLENGAVWRRKAAEVARDALRSYFAAQGRRGVQSPFATARP